MVLFCYSTPFFAPVSWIYLQCMHERRRKPWSMFEQLRLDIIKRILLHIPIHLFRAVSLNELFDQVFVVGIAS